MSKPYSEKLRDPRWQRKRLAIMERDGFKCQDCQSETNELQIHHTVYIPSIEPWEYPHDLIVTLCCDCHPKRQKIETAVHCSIARLIANEPPDLMEEVAWRLCDQAIQEANSVNNDVDMVRQ